MDLLKRDISRALNAMAEVQPKLAMEGDLEEVARQLNGWNTELEEYLVTLNKFIPYIIAWRERHTQAVKEVTYSINMDITFRVFDGNLAAPSLVESVIRKALDEIGISVIGEIGVEVNLE